MPGILIGMLLDLRARRRRRRRGQDPRRPVDHRHHPRHRDRLHLRAELAARLGARGASDARRRHADAEPASPASTSTASWGGADGGHAARRPGASPAERTERRAAGFIAAWTVFVVVAVYLPIALRLPRLLNKSRYFRFPIVEFSLDWWQRTTQSIEIGVLVRTSLSIAALVTAIAVVIAFFGALAYARYDWKGRRLYQKVVLLPIFFPQPVLGLALLLWFNALGITLVLADRGVRASRLDRAGRDPRHGDPDVRLRPGARGGRDGPRRQPIAGHARGDAADPVARHLVGRALRLPPVVGQFPAVALHDGPGHRGARMALRQDGGGLYADGAGARLDGDGRGGRWSSSRRASCCASSGGGRRHERQSLDALCRLGQAAASARQVREGRSGERLLGDEEPRRSPRRRAC